jgi:hypothetical protein
MSVVLNNPPVSVVLNNPNIILPICHIGVKQISKINFHPTEAPNEIFPGKHRAREYSKTKNMPQSHLLISIPADFHLLKNPNLSFQNPKETKNGYLTDRKETRIIRFQTPHP